MCSSGTLAFSGKSEPIGLSSASYIGDEIAHLYGSSELNPAIFFPGNANGSGQCSLKVTH